MILSDVDIKTALKEKNLIIEPEPSEEQIDSTTIDLRIGEYYTPPTPSQEGIMRNADSGERSAVVWDGKDESGKQVSAGVYFYRLSAGNFTATKKMILVR
ncbi:MAG: hypothetical protein AB1393_09640 [Candidatus Edwardsbacteria bacterium]